MINNNKLNPLQFSCLLIFPILSMFSGIGLYNIIKISNIDSYISTIISTILGLLIILLFINILNYEKDLTLPEKNIKLFGPLIGNIINYIINILTLIIAISLIYSISNFIISQFLSATPPIIILVLMSLTTIYAISKGIETISRTSIIFFIIIILLTITSTIGLIPNFDIKNIKPILEHGINPTIKGGIILTLTNIVPIFILLIIPKNNITNNNKVSKYIIITYLISMLFIFLATLLTIASLGTHLLNLFPPPEYMVLKKISILGFIDRIENIIYIKWLLTDFISFTLLIYYISNSINKKKKQIIIPIITTIIVIYLSQLLFKDNTIFKHYTTSIYPYLNLLYLTIMIIIASKILLYNIQKKSNT